MANCYLCGQNGRIVELESAENGISVNGVEIPANAFICIDDVDCESTVIAKRHDYPEDVEDTPSLEPWWHNR